MQERDSVTVLHGVGSQKAAKYARLGIETVGDLVRHYPRGYVDWSHPTTASVALANTPCCVRGTVISDVEEHFVRKGMVLYRFRVSDGENPVLVVLFNNRYAAAKIRRGQEWLLYGVVTKTANHYEMSAPQMETVSAGLRIRPLYRQTEGLSGRQIEADIRQALEHLSVEDMLPESIRTSMRLTDAATALHDIHFPPDEEALDAARHRVVAEELLVFQIGLMRLKGRSRSDSGAVIQTDYTREYVEKLPFALTGSQQRAIDTCVADLKENHPMARLVQGDVGSGKTAVAAGVAYTVIRAGYQVAMMAPTEILAQQHRESLCKLLGDKIRVGLLTGSVPSAERKKTETALAAGEIDLVVGTHALISEPVTFAKLGLVITDEQHRFGVRQRAQLADKGVHPHMLVMSATPIPRTLALILYGDLDVSVLDELPPGRQPVATYAVTSQKRERAYGYVRKFLDQGKQGFVVCPLVEEGEEPSDRNAATTVFEELVRGPFRGYRLGLLHGRMKPAEKEATMTAFAAGDIQLLVSTTVIEVGVDVPNAAVLLIENADLFGLAQLHQLRGRVGRGTGESACILISDNAGEENRRRLQVMCATNDGFRIADEDLKLRGPGDFFGNRQHGLPQLRAADLMRDMPLFEQAKMQAVNLLARDETLSLPENRLLRQAVGHLFSQVGEQGLN